MPETLKSYPELVKKLQQLQINDEALPALYKTVIEMAARADELAVIFATLKELGIPHTQGSHLELYHVVIEEEPTVTQAILDKIKQLNLEAPDDFELINNALKAGAAGREALTWLHENKFAKEHHRCLYDAFFLGGAPLVRSPYILAKVKYLLQDYFFEKKEQPLTSDNDAYHAQREDVLQIITKVINAAKEVTKGPLAKSAASQEVEMMLKRIAASTLDTTQMKYTNDVGYLLQFENEPEIYLSELLKLASFNHIELLDEQVNALGEKIEALSTGRFNEQPIKTELKFVAMLPDAAKRALSLYVDVNLSAYKNINRLFRGVVLTNDAKSTWDTSFVKSSDNLLTNFLVGSLLNWSAAELPRKLFTPKNDKY